MLTQEKQTKLVKSLINNETYMYINDVGLRFLPMQLTVIMTWEHVDPRYFVNKKPN